MSVPIVRNVKVHRFLARCLPLARYVVCSPAYLHPDCGILWFLIASCSSLAFYAAIIAIPLISHLKERNRVDEHAYLHGLIPDNVRQEGMNFMIDTVASLSKACDIHNDKVIEQSMGLEPFSRWHEDLPEDAPAVYKAIASIVKKEGLRFDVAYNDFRYVFDSGLGITGTSLLLHMKCARCASRGSTLAVATVDTGSKREFIVDERGYVKKSHDATGNNSKCSSSITGASIAFAALREMSRYDNQVQDVLLLITDRNLPYAAGTRQFLDDYFSRPDFKWRGGWLHHAVSLDLGYGRCGRYEMNYEGLDGAIPNIDVVTSFLYEADSQDVSIEMPGLWERIGRMSTNSSPHLPHVPMLSRSIAAFSVTCAKKAEKSDPNQADKLMRTLLVTLRMQNNLETVLERSVNAYQMVDRAYYLPQGAYLLLVPALLLGPTAELLYSAYTWDFHVLVASLCVFLLNAFMGPWLSYRYLVATVGSDFDGFSTRNQTHVKIAILLLFCSSGVLLLANLLLFRVAPDCVFSQFDTERDVQDRQSVLLKLGYSVDSGSLLVQSLVRLGILMDRLRRKSDYVMGMFFRTPEPDVADSKRKRLSMKIGALVQKLKPRNADASSSSVLTTPRLRSEDTAVWEVISATKQEYKRQLDEMVGTQIAFPTNPGLPAPEVIVSVGTLFFAIVFLYAMMIFHWPLSIVLALALVPSLRRVKLWKQNPYRCWADLVICATYLLCIAILALRRNLIGGLRREFMEKVYAGGRFNILIFGLSPFYNLYVFLKNFPASEIAAAFKGPQVTQKLFALAQQHVLFGSGTFPLIWFCAIPLVFHTVLIYTMTYFYKPPSKRR